MKITKQQLKQIIKEELENLIEADEAWVLRKSGTTDAASFLQPTPALAQKKGESKWGPKQSARTFKGDNGKARAADEQKKLKKNGVAVSIEKTEIIKEERFAGGSIDIDPLSDEEQDASTDAYYELYDHLMNSDLPGNKPSEQLKYALRWIAKFEKEGIATRAYQAKLDDAPVMGRFVRGLKESKK